MDDFDDLDDLGSLDDFDDLDGLTLEDNPPAPQHPGDAAGVPSPAAPSAPPVAPAAVAPAAAAPVSGLGAVIQDLLGKRNFTQVLQIAENQKDALTQDPHALEMVQTAQSRLESENYVVSFLKAASAARDSGDSQGMQEQLAKARALDPEHPAIVAFSTAMTAAPIAAAPPAAPIAAAPPAAPIAAAPPAAPIAPPPATASDDGFLSFSEDAPPLALEADAPPAAAAGPPPAAMPDDDLLDLEMEDLSLEEPIDDVPLADNDDLAMSFDEAPAVPAAEPIAFEAGPSDGGEGGDAEGGGRILGLLAEGKEMFEQGEYQAAIDVWSRIFLIDIDNTEASRLIEEARSKKAELERQAEELFHQGTEHIESRELEEAKAAFQQVLEIDSGHSLAREYLEQLEAGQVPTLSRSGDAEILTPPDGTEDGAAGGEGPQSMEAAVERDRIVVTKKMDRRLIGLGALVAILVVGGGAFLATQWDDLFPNQQESVAAPVRRTDPIEKATKLHEAGKTDGAIRLLETLVESDPVYQDAQALITQWRAEAEAPPEDVPTGPSEGQLARRVLLLEAAHVAHAENRFIRARKYFNAAAKIVPLDGIDAQTFATGNTTLASLSKEIDLFEKAEYEVLIPGLWRRREKEQNNPDLDLLLIDSYYNLALTDLQRGDALGAAEKLKDALQVQPDNRELQRMELFAKTYSSRSTDLLYRIFVKYLPSRS